MQEILDMVRYVAVFYLLEQMVLNLLPGKIYEKYVRFYLGLLLVLLLLQPMFRIFRLTEQMDTEALMYELEQEVEELR
ncbi:MAG: stage III sporulation protein AF [Clostridiales bacterium]|nr:stage III sporulation protein AF [Clostridiales bacterium]